MSWIASVGVGLLISILGAFGTGFFGSLWADWYRIPTREGGAAYFVILLGLLGGLLGLIIGLVTSRVVATGNSPGFLHGLGLAASITLGLLALAMLIGWLGADLDTKVGGNAVELHAEICCPTGFEIAANATQENWYAHVDTRTRRSTSWAPLQVSAARREEGRWVIPMKLGLRTSVREKLLYVRLGEETQLFIPRFSSRPAPRFFTWSEWEEGGWEAGKPRPPAEQRFSLRFRLEVVPAPAPPAPVPPGPTVAQLEAADQAALAALSPASPLEECMRFTHYTQAEERRRAAGAIIGQRPAVLAELTAQILSSDPETVDRALRSLVFIRPLPAGLAGPVAVQGEKVIRSLETFNASTPKEDPTYQGAADSSILFSRWFQAHHALHDFAGVDGLPLLKRILELSTRRNDSAVLKDDIARVARHYIGEWTREAVAE